VTIRAPVLNTGDPKLFTSFNVDIVAGDPAALGTPEFAIAVINGPARL
jgi:hypothetical protein